MPNLLSDAEAGKVGVEERPGGRRRVAAQRIADADARRVDRDGEQRGGEAGRRMELPAALLGGGEEGPHDERQRGVQDGVLEDDDGQAAEELDHAGSLQLSADGGGGCGAAKADVFLQGALEQGRGKPGLRFAGGDRARDRCL